ncbi:MerR family transcriptional regulator [Oenococcus sicerae]|uniref:MerR family transcriptional regulator n=1 Tax=Oenococcus sicerae TaxID=2203724 RepID=A0AAJ1VN28_9LACO|nr:MerR family transcriptional regulator [Oenococcus sicerae]MDN6899779.1 MerR family transcriptional regulator [Oenococcus sicerae]
MQLKIFMATVNAKHDTFRFYIEKNLLTPDKVAGKYVFTSQDVANYEEIMQLKKLGFSIETIRKIKQQHILNCSTTEQWQQNLALVENNINLAEQELKRIEQQKEALIKVSKQLESLLARQH